MDARRVSLAAAGLALLLAAASVRGGEPAAGPEGAVAAEKARTVVIGAPSPEDITPGGRIPVIDIVEERLEHVLAYLSHYGRVNIRAVDQRTKELVVSVRLENVGWRDVLSYLATYYKLVVDERDVRRGFIYVSKPVPVKVQTPFPGGADIREVIRMIADQSGEV